MSQESCQFSGLHISSTKTCFQVGMLGYEGLFPNLRIQLCPKKEITSTIPFYKDGMFRPSILLYSYP